MIIIPTAPELMQGVRESPNYEIAEIITMNKAA